MRYFPDLAQLVIVLEGTEPVVWRRVHVSFFAKLGGLHRTIQSVMGWDSSFPHHFVLMGDIYRRVARGERLDAAREKNWRLDSAFYPDKSFLYVCGPNEEWTHRIMLEDYLERRPYWRYPRCVGGACATPPGSAETFSVGRANRRLWRRRHPNPLTYT